MDPTGYNPFDLVIRDDPYPFRRAAPVFRRRSSEDAVARSGRSAGVIMPPTDERGRPSAGTESRHHACRTRASLSR